MVIEIPITTGYSANDDITIPEGKKLNQLGVAFEFVGSNGTLAAAFSALTVNTRGDGNSGGAGEIKLQADGTKIRCGDALDAADCLTLYGIAPGEAQGFGES